MAKKTDIDWNKYIEESMAAEKAATERAKIPPRSFGHRFLVGLACVAVTYGAYRSIAWQLKPSEPAIVPIVHSALPPIEHEQTDVPETPQQNRVRVQQDLPPTGFPSEYPSVVSVPVSKSEAETPQKVIKNQIVMPSQLNQPGRASVPKDDTKKKVSDTPLPRPRGYWTKDGRFVRTDAIQPPAGVPEKDKKTVHVKGYTTKNGTVVQPYDRSAPTSSKK